MKERLKTKDIPPRAYCKIFITQQLKQIGYNNKNNMYNPQNQKFNQNYQNEDNEINTTRKFHKDIPIQYRNASLSDLYFNNNNNPNVSL